MVARGLVRVSIHSSTGVRVTYLLAGPGEPLNLVGPFTGGARPYAAEALTDACVAEIRRDDFISFTFKNPVVLSNIIGILGEAVDSANSRILDMMDKKVHQRLERVLYTLYRKFGSILEFTSGELAELAGTTTESTLRAMARFRACGIVRTGRGRIVITNPEILGNPNTPTLWI
jgi:CRP-like cAMP-binding protein